jgi:hypothetical protein
MGVRKNIFLRYLITASTLSLLYAVMVSSSHAQQPPPSRGGERGSQQSLWGGIWSTDYGTIEFGQHGNIVVGYYGTENGRIWGTVRGDKLEYEWEVQPAGGEPSNGDGEFTINPRSDQFTGFYRYAYDDTSRFDWNGSRTGDRIVEGTTADVDYCLWTGFWTFDGGGIIFDQDADSLEVNGEFVKGDLHILFTGTASGWSIDLNFENPDGSLGSGRLTMTASLENFTGEINLDQSGTPISLEGEFKSSRIREDMSGQWRLTWGDAEIVQDDLSGVVSGTIAGAHIGDRNGQCVFDGFIIGDNCIINWTITGSDGQVSGNAKLVFISADSVDGTWSVEGESASTGKLAGSRE